MKKLLFFICFVAGTNVLFAQTDVAAKYAEVITGKNLKKHLSIIAGDEMQGRETGTEGQRKAAAYIESQFKAMGLKSVESLKGYQQFYPLYQDSLKEAELTVAGKTAEYGKDFIVQLNNNETGSFKGKKIIFAGYGIDDEKYSDYTGLDVKGKIVV
ncbi:MAG: peptidase, partial [Flavobacterium sp.]